MELTLHLKISWYKTLPGAVSKGEDFSQTTSNLMVCQLLNLKTTSLGKEMDGLYIYWLLVQHGGNVALPVPAAFNA